MGLGLGFFEAGFDLTSEGSGLTSCSTSGVMCSGPYNPHSPVHSP
jgi:hypothetical protein